MKKRIEVWAFGYYMTIASSIIATGLLIYAAALLNREYVYYPSWSGELMYFDKQEVNTLNFINGRDSTEIDSAYVIY